MPIRDKKFLREIKRSVKKKGNKQKRAFFKKNLLKNPEEAHFCDHFDFGDMASKKFNGMDQDATRKLEDQ